MSIYQQEWHFYSWWLIVNIAGMIWFTSLQPKFYDDGSIQTYDPIKRRLAAAACAGRAFTIVIGFLPLHPLISLALSPLPYVFLFGLTGLHLITSYQVFSDHNALNAAKLRSLWALPDQAILAYVGWCVLLTALFFGLGVSMIMGSEEVSQFFIHTGTLYLSASYLAAALVVLFVFEGTEGEVEIKGHRLEYHEPEASGRALASCCVAAACINQFSGWYPEAFFRWFYPLQGGYLLVGVVVPLIVIVAGTPSILVAPITATDRPRAADARQALAA